MKCPCCKYEDYHDSFEHVTVVEGVQLRNTYYEDSYELDVDNIFLNICPKCGVAFKEVS